MHTIMFIVRRVYIRRIYINKILFNWYRHLTTNYNSLTRRPTQARSQDFRKGGRIFHEVDLLRCRPKEQPPKAVANRCQRHLQRLGSCALAHEPLMR